MLGKENLCIKQNLPSSFGSSKKLNEALRIQLRLAEDVISFAIKRNIPDRGNFSRTEEKSSHLIV
jgi:hypothetical protein